MTRNILSKFYSIPSRNVEGIAFTRNGMKYNMKPPFSITPYYKNKGKQPWCCTVNVGETFYPAFPNAA